MPQMKISAAGIPWYRREQYARVLEVMEDANLLSPTYDEWLERAEQAFKRVERQGVIAHKVEIDPETFPIWCRARGLNVNADARIQFANHHAALIQRDKH